MDKTILSVVVCTFNRRLLLEEALESVMQQKTTFPFEIIVGDDCSSDDTRSFLESYREKHPNKVVLSFMAENSGIGANWATALLKAQGRYVAFLDDDDFWTDNRRMQIMVDYLEQHPEVDLLYTNGYNWNEKTGRKEMIIFPRPEELDCQKIWEGSQASFQLNMVMVRRKTLEECINLNDYIAYQFPIQDWNTDLFLVKNARCAYMDMPTCVIRYSAGSLSHPKTYEQVIKKYEKEKTMYNYIADHFPDDPVIKRDDAGFDCYVNHILTTVAFQRGDYRKAKHYSKLSGGSSFRDKCTRTWLSFHLYRLLRFIKRCESIYKISLFRVRF